MEEGRKKEKKKKKKKKKKERKAKELPQRSMFLSIDNGDSMFACSWFRQRTHIHTQRKIRHLQNITCFL